jgi:hypothetical protein
LFTTWEPLWLSGKVVKNEKINEMRGPGFAPHPGQPLFLKKTLFTTFNACSGRKDKYVGIEGRPKPAPTTIKN